MGGAAVGLKMFGNGLIQGVAILLRASFAFRRRADQFADPCQSSQLKPCSESHRHTFPPVNNCLHGKTRNLNLGQDTRAGKDQGKTGGLLSSFVIRMKG